MRSHEQRSWREEKPTCHIFRLERCASRYRVGVAEMACGSKEFNPPFPFPPRASRGGAGSPHAGSTLPASKKHASMHRCCRLPPQGKCPRGAGPYARGTWFTGWGRGRLKGAQVAEVGRSPSGAVKAKHKRGPKFRAPYSGYGLRQHPRLIPIRRVLDLRDLAPT